MNNEQGKKNQPQQGGQPSQGQGQRQQSQQDNTRRQGGMSPQQVDRDDEDLKQDRLNRDPAEGK